MEDKAIKAACGVRDGNHDAVQRTTTAGSSVSRQRLVSPHFKIQISIPRDPMPLRQAWAWGVLEKVRAKITDGHTR